LEVYISRDGYHYRVVSKIVEVGEGHVCATLIASGARVFEFMPTDVVDLVYREDEHMWKWNSVQGSVVLLDGEKFHCFTTEVEEGESYNRRNAFRVPLEQELTIQYLVRDLERLHEVNDMEALHSQTEFDDDAELDALQEDCFRFVDCAAMLKDISELGAGLYANKRLEKGDELSFVLDTEFGKICCNSVIVRRTDSRLDSFRYYYGCRFLETSRNLSRFVYEKQREQLKKLRYQYYEHINNNGREDE
ncbi:MAG: PilZ domain-containing protein, partial [Lachnospiraceae bacterium]|nr:PilZ domain-containing protein [Lachnospiraceae bacterium]